MPKIFIPHDYGGAMTGERRILPGEYTADDARLFGIADYLVANGHAVVVTEDEPPQYPDAPPLPDGNDEPQPTRRSRK